MKRLVKRIGRKLGRWLGPRSGPIILLYHRVAELDTDPQLLAVTPENFRTHLEILREYGDPCRIDDLATRGGTLPLHGIAVTFDDGYADNLIHAAPLLAQHEVPATVFVASGQVGAASEFWWDELERVFLHPGSLPETISLTIRRQVHTYELGAAANYSPRDFETHRRWNVLIDESPTPRQQAYREICAAIRALPVSERKTVLAELRIAAGVSDDGRPQPSREDYRSLTPRQVGELDSYDVMEVGAHTVHHPVLSRLTPAAQRAEILDSRRRLEASGVAVGGFAYPFGTGGDFNRITEGIVRQAGFRYACANEEGFVTSRTNPYRLPRYLVRNWDGETFARKLEEWTGVRETTARRAG